MTVSGDCGYGVGSVDAEFNVPERAWVNLDAPGPEAPLVGEVVGVVCRKGDGEAGESGRRNGELRVGGDP